MPNTSSAMTSSSRLSCCTLSRRPAPKSRSAPASELEQHAARVLVGGLSIRASWPWCRPSRDRPACRRTPPSAPGRRAAAGPRARWRSRRRCACRAPSARPACTSVAPGQASWMAVTAARISVLLTTAVPAGVTGAVAPEDRHGVEKDRDAGVGQGEGEIHAETLLVKGRDGAEDDREQGSRPELVAAAGHEFGHAQQRLGLGGVFHADHNGVLVGGAHAGVELVQDARLDGTVLRGDDGRCGREIGKGVHDAGRLVHVLLAAAPDAAVVSAHQRGAAV